jgi:hypothetical protein
MLRTRPVFRAVSAFAIVAGMAFHASAQTVRKATSAEEAENGVFHRLLKNIRVSRKVERDIRAAIHKEQVAQEQLDPRDRRLMQKRAELVVRRDSTIRSLLPDSARRSTFDRNRVPR